MDNDRAQIPADLLELVEKLAENTHNAWSAQRLAEGWSYGPERDDFKKTHPCLVPYQELPESEKEYDRKISLGTLQTILGWGYRITSPAEQTRGKPGSGFLPPEGEDPSQRRGRELPRLDLNKTLALWQSLKSLDEGVPEKSYEDFGQHLLRLGEPLMAYDLISEGLRPWPQNTRLRQLRALALLRSGAVQQALTLLEKLYEEGCRDEETMGLLARARKAQAEQVTDPAEKNRQWRQAYEIYAAAYEQTGGYWTGINAATAARYLGERRKAVALANRVMDQCLRELPAKKEDEGELYWLKATLGEAALIREEWEEAQHWYTQAAQAAGRRYGDLASTRRNASLLLEAMGADSGQRRRLEACFRLPRVAVFAGHMIDQPGRALPRFPSHLEGQVARRLEACLERFQANIGVASAACGADILFLEAMLAREGEIIVVLPFDQAAFQKTSVDIIPGADWGQRFQRVLAQASRVIIASDNRTTGNAVTYAYANLLLDGLAILRARMLDTEVLPLVVWDGRAGDGPGGTASLVRHWQSHGLAYEVIDITRLAAAPPEGAALSGLGRGPAGQDGGPGSPAPDFTQEILAMLFADVVGSSRIKDEQVPIFVEHFIGAIHGLIAESSFKPLLTNTWGDALYGVFATVRDAANFALQLRDRISLTDWEEKGLPRDINLRISLHAGPVYCYKKPFFQEAAYAGAHIVRAARIEPITPPGQVYASQQFAALASAQRVGDCICEYVGQIPLPKHSGVIPLYLVRRKNP